MCAAPQGGGPFFASVSAIPSTKLFEAVRRGFSHFCNQSDSRTEELGLAAGAITMKPFIWGGILSIELGGFALAYQGSQPRPLLELCRSAEEGDGEEDDSSHCGVQGPKFAGPEGE